MNHSFAFTQNLFDCRDAEIVGGKALNLGRLTRAGFLVPGGFVVTTHAYRAALTQAETNGGGIRVTAEIANEVLGAYRAMGAGAVAVRSSATCEDLASSSMAGQFDTSLDIDGEAELLQAVERCWASVNAPRVRAYLDEEGIDPAKLAMAVVVQRLIPAEAAGVLFTVNPQHGEHREMLIEASWGLGEAVVSGRVQPDRLRIDRATGKTLAVTVADNRVQAADGDRPESSDDEARQRGCCLRGRDVDRLWKLGRRVAEHFESPQDIEWAVSAGEVYLLQSRPITTDRDAEAREEVVRAAREQLRDASSQGRGPWALHNLAETLPHPTPLTWSVVRQFMSGSGGLGAMYRRAGFNPSESVDRDGFLDLIAGRIYMDLSRAPEMFFADFPFRYDVEYLKRRPDAAQAPPTLPSGSLASRLKGAKRLSAANRKLQKLASDFDRELRERYFPAMIFYVETARRIDLASLSASELIALWRRHEEEVLRSFGSQSLLPGLICAMALDELKTLLQENFWDLDPDALAQQLSSGSPLNRTVAADSELYEVGKGSRLLELWIADHGHRAFGEFDLASPRWREQTQVVGDLATQLAAGEHPLARHGRNVEEVERRIGELGERLPRADRREFERRVNQARRYIGFREDSKDFLMLGYDLLRDVAREAGQRLDIADDVFYLTREELFDSLQSGFAPFGLIQQRKHEFSAAVHVDLPSVIDAATVDSLGEPSPQPRCVGDLAGLPISSGQATGPARILHSPTVAGAMEPGYVLVCPSTDPSWTPLFVSAAAIVLQCGGVLSHGAIVAREMGIPAVVVPNATRLFGLGEQITVDGDRGIIHRAGANVVASEAVAPLDVADTRVPFDQIPPPPGRKDRAAAKFRNWFGAGWMIFLAAFFLFPETWVRRPAMASADSLLWPMVRAWGKPATVIIIAAGMAIVTMAVQKMATDNRRLREAKRRAKTLESQAASFPEKSPRRQALQRLAAPVQMRLLAAAMVPIGILLGPMIVSIVWLGERMDPARWNAPPGSSLQIVATVDSDWTEPVHIEAPAGFVVDDATSAERTLPPLRKTLEQLLAHYRQPAAERVDSPELTVVPDLAREQVIADLRSYLDSGIPPQGITWSVRPPSDAEGMFPIVVAAGGDRSAKIDIVLGDRHPPEPSKATPPVHSPIKAVAVFYPKAKTEPVFWRPFAQLAENRHSPFSAPLSSFAIGWLLLYLLVYLPTMFLVRWILKVT
jgi:rifampicin phosphotransferase